MTVCCHRIRSCLSPAMLLSLLNSCSPACLLFPSQHVSCGGLFRRFYLPNPVSGDFMLCRTWFQCHALGEAFKNCAWELTASLLSHHLIPYNTYHYLQWSYSLVHVLTFYLLPKECGCRGEGFHLSCLLLYHQFLNSTQYFKGLDKYLWLKLLNKFS